MSTSAGTLNRPTEAAPTDEVLSDWHKEILSKPAQKMYEAIWHRMRLRKVPQIWMDDVEASTRSRIAIQFIPNARAELSSVGLLQCREGSKQGSKQWLYSYMEQSGTDDEFGAEQ